MGEASPSSLSQSSRRVLERIALQMVSSLDLQIVLTTITQGLVEELDKAFARSWLLIRDHQHVQDVLVGEAFGMDLGLGHYKILATVPEDVGVEIIENNSCKS